MQGVVAGLVLLLGTVLAFGVIVSSTSAGPGSPFGGQITSVFYCNCSGNYRLTVGPPVGGTFIYQPGATIVYQYGMITSPGVWILGTYVGNVSCRWWCGRGCCASVYPMIYMAGTSM